MAITEKFVKEQVKKILSVYARYNDVYTFCPMTFGYGERGHPDRIVVVNGAFIGLEAKKDANNYHCRPELKPKPNEAAQKIQAERITKAGGNWLCVHSGNLSALVSLLDSVCKVPLVQFSHDDRKRVAYVVATSMGD